MLFFVYIMPCHISISSRPMTSVSINNHKESGGGIWVSNFMATCTNGCTQYTISTIKCLQSRNVWTIQKLIIQVHFCGHFTCNHNWNIRVSSRVGRRELNLCNWKSNVAWKQFRWRYRYHECVTDSIKIVTFCKLDNRYRFVWCNCNNIIHRYFSLVKFPFS